MIAVFSGQLTHTITLPEVIWFLIGLVGLVISYRNMIAAQSDLTVVSYVGRNGRYRAIAVGNLREEALRVFKCIVITGIGAAAMIAPPTNAATPVSALSLIITFGLFLIGLAIVTGSVAAARARALLLKYPIPPE